MFLDISPEEAMKRGGYGEEKYEKKEMQDNVRRLFAVMMESKEGEDFVRIDAGRSMEEVHADIKSVVREAMEKVDKEERQLRVVAPW